LIRPSYGLECFIEEISRREVFVPAKGVPRRRISLRIMLQPETTGMRGVLRCPGLQMRPHIPPQPIPKPLAHYRIDRKVLHGLIRT